LKENLFSFPRIFTSIVGSSSNLLICFLNISSISSIVNKSTFDEVSLAKEIGEEITDEAEWGGTVKTFEAKTKRRSIERKEIKRFQFIRVFVDVRS
jgi:hypothetical protein